MAITLSPGARITVRRPRLPVVNAERPQPTRAVVVPLRGPQGPRGPAGDDADSALAQHIASATPHPAYDEGPSLALLFDNALI